MVSFVKQALLTMESFWLGVRIFKPLNVSKFVVRQGSHFQASTLFFSLWCVASRVFSPNPNCFSKICNVCIYTVSEGGSYETAISSLYANDWPKFSVKDQIVSSFGFASHMVSVATIQFRLCSVKQPSTVCK